MDVIKFIEVKVNDMLEKTDGAIMSDDTKAYNAGYTQAICDMFEAYRSEHGPRFPVDAGSKKN